MAVSVERIYDRTCDALLEPGGLQLGLLTEDQFLAILESVIDDFTDKTQLVKDLFSVPASVGVSDYSYASSQVSLDEVFYDKIYLKKSDAFSLDHSSSSWESDQGIPERWYQDRSGQTTFSVYPKPSETGKTFTLIGAKNPISRPLGLLDTVAEIPASFEFYIWAGVMAKIHSMDGELKDDFKATYFTNRYTEGVNLARAVMSEALLTA